MRLAGPVTCLSKIRKAHRVLVGKPERKRLFGRPRASWEDNVKWFLNSVTSLSTQFIAVMMGDQ
jgi:hypothetical protein